MNLILSKEEFAICRSLSFLPWAHCIVLNCELNNLLQGGSQIALAQDVTTLAENIKEVKPNILFAVPTVYKKIYDKIQDKVGVLNSVLCPAVNLSLPFLLFSFLPYSGIFPRCSDTHPCKHGS